MTRTLGKRLEVLEVAAYEHQLERFRAAVRALRGSLAPDQARALRDWILEHDIKAVACPSFHPDARFCLDCIDAMDPPALMRAMWVLLFEHLERGGPVVLPTEVARVYLDHADAVPAIPCPQCRYLLPSRDGRLAYAGACPGCPAVSDGRR